MLIVCFSYAQNQKTLLLSDSLIIAISLDKNLLIKQAEKAHDKSMAEFRQSKEWIFPDIYTGARMHQLSGAAMNAEGALLDGVERSSSWAGIGANALWNPGNGLLSAQVAKAHSSASMHELSSIKNKTVLKVLELYYSWLKEKSKLKVLNELNESSSKLLGQLKLQSEVGRLYQSEYLMARSNHAHYELMASNAELQIYKIVSKLRLALNLGDTVKLSSNSNLEAVDDNVAYIDNAYSLRPELANINSRLKGKSREIMAYKASFMLPSIQLNAYQALFGEYQLNLYNTNELNVSLLWRFSLGEILSRGNIHSLNAEYQSLDYLREYVESSLKSELNTLYYNWLKAKKDIEVSLTALEASRKSHSQTLARQALRTAKPFEVFQAQEYLFRAESDHLEQIYSLNMAYYGLVVALGNSF
jgi:outer membrane protein TolC